MRAVDCDWELRKQNTGDRSQESEYKKAEDRIKHVNKAKSFQDLIVWRKAHEFVLCVYQLTKKFPREEIYCLTSQFRMAAISIPANIAEGFKKKGKPDKVRFFNIAQSSLEECRYYLILSEDLKYADSSELHLLLEEVSKLLEAYSSSILTPIS